MKVTTKNGNYSVSFQHNNVSDRNVKGTTLCRIEKQNDDKWTEVSVGSSVKHVGDVYDKELGRKMTLKRAISPFNKEERQIFWKTYLGRKSK